MTETAHRFDVTVIAPAELNDECAPRLHNAQRIAPLLTTFLDQVRPADS